MPPSSSVTKVRVSGMEPLRSFTAGVAEAWRKFGALVPAELDTLPRAAREGITELSQAIRELAGENPPRIHEEPEQYRGVIAVEWPAPSGASPYSAMTGHKVEITDAVTGKPIRTCLHLTVTAGMEAIVTADLTMLADENGEPLPDGEPVTKDGEILTGVFPFLVSEMRVHPA